MAKSGRKIEFNPPFDFLFKDMIKKIKKEFPHIQFKLYPTKTTKKEMFEQLLKVEEFSNASVILELVEFIKI